VSVTEDILKEFFCKCYGSVLGVKVIIDPVIKNSKGYGFVRFGDQNEANKALTEMNGKVLHGKPIKTKYILINIFLPSQASFKKLSGESSGTTHPNQISYSNIPSNQSPYNNHLPNSGIDLNQQIINNSYTNIYNPSLNNDGLNAVGKGNKAMYNNLALKGNPHYSKYNSEILQEAKVNTYKSQVNLNHLNNFYIQYVLFLKLT